MHQPYDEAVIQEDWNTMAYVPPPATDKFYDANSGTSSSSRPGDSSMPANTSRASLYESYQSPSSSYLREREGDSISHGSFDGALAREAYQHSVYRYGDQQRPLPVAVTAEVLSSKGHIASSGGGNINEASTVMVPNVSDASNRPPLSIVTDASLVRNETNYSSSLARNIHNTPKTNSSGSSTLFWPDTPGSPNIPSSSESGARTAYSVTPKQTRRHKGSLDISLRDNPLFTSIGSNEEFESSSMGRSVQYQSGSLRTRTPRSPIAMGIVSSLTRDSSFASDSSLSTTVSVENKDVGRQIAVARGPRDASSSRKPVSKAPFQVSSSSSSQANTTLDAPPDQYTRQFLHEQLGERKFGIFVSRLYERRLNGEKVHLAKARAKSRKQESGANAAVENEAGVPEFSATTIDFLVKVEVVKEVLRLFVPKPYELAKHLSHEYPPSPSGEVTFTRAIVLSLCGWSNTQFAYWARRVEALSVLSEHDDRLKVLADALERKHYSDDAGQTDVLPKGSQGQPVAGDEFVTGKGLDSIIDDVKQRTGASQFIRGRHSNLDAFGTSEALRAVRSVLYDANKEEQEAEDIEPPSTPARPSTSRVDRSPSPPPESELPRMNTTFSPIYRLGTYRHSPPPPSDNSSPGPSIANHGQTCFNVYAFPPRRFVSRSSSGSSGDRHEGNSSPETTRMTFRISDSRGSPHPKAATISSGSPSEKGQVGSKRKASIPESDSRKRTKRWD